MGVGRETLIVILASAIQSGSSALAYWMSARLQTPAEFGIAMSLMGLATSISSIADFGITNFTIREMAASNEPLLVFRRTLGNKLLMAVVMSLVWSGVSGLLVLGHLAPIEAVLYGPLFLVGPLEATYQAGLRGTGRMSRYSLSISLDKIAFLIAALVLGLIFRAPQLVFPIGLLVGSVAGLAAVSPMIKDVGLMDGGLGSFRELLFLFKQSSRFGMVGFANMSQRLDVAVVSMFAGSLQSGYYAAPARLTGPLSIIPLALGTVIFPRSARTADVKRSHNELVKGFVLIGVLMCPLIVVLFIFTPVVVTKLLGDNYISSGSVLRVVLVGLLFAVFIEPLATFLQGKRDERFVSNVIVVSTIVGLGACAVGARVAGATGAGFGYAIRQGGILIVMAFRYRHFLRGQMSPNKGIVDMNHNLY
ncbi:MAG: oligosaccharide flippase family protein [Alicyclobacillus sp.]|nr:oligosaccharide flippase family protein [Alicyclobacillus sp.]